MKIAVIGDLHYPALEEGYLLTEEERNVFYEKFLERFFSIPADLYVSIGDLTNFGWKEELEEVYAIIDQHQKPFVHVLGNHDIYGSTREEVLMVTKQQRYRAFRTDSAALAFLDTAKEQDFEDWGGTLDAEQLDWLEGVIEESGELPLLVFAHHPVHATTTNSNQAMLSIHPDIPVWELLSKKQGCGLYVNGHNHFNSVDEREQWNFLQIAAVLDEQAVRVIEVSDSHISIDSVDLYDPELNKQAQVIGDAINHFQLNPHPLGIDSDMKHLIPLPVSVSEEPEKV
ncbi:metallophosphoesterase family protein [Planococcus shenhongbingii]|uniref:Metallophosphoesterase n=1 Tax=Planococcus shenhongbingii TaxID=3058398 RepID=A0ABT8NB92_9BACL|nr:metallophosphoesterase [Planococcus sp. N017]MDN7245157.1 metallophosphoesterase [Planococcus sp. N017]